MLDMVTADHLCLASVVDKCNFRELCALYDFSAFSLTGKPYFVCVLYVEVVDLANKSIGPPLNLNLR